MNERRLKFYRYGGRPARLVAFRSLILSSIASLLILLAMIGSASGQDQPQIQTAPPPLKVVPKAERESLEKENKPKDRTKLALELMDLRLTKAEAANTSDDLSLTFAELGIFHALMDNTLIFLDEVHRSTGKSLDNFKRFEIGLRRFTPRLEMLRREMPLTHEYYIRSLLRQLRDARTKATEPLFGDSVISNL